MSLYSELKRRNVFRVAIAYLAFAWLIVQVAETLFPVFDLPFESVRIVVIVLSIGFFPAVIIAWLYELTPEGFKLEEEIDHGSRRYRAGDKRLDRAIIAVLTLGLGYFALDKFVLEPIRDVAREAVIAEAARTEALHSAFAESSIAVMPFVNTGDYANEYFADGVSEELLKLLSRIRRLKVISRSSAFSFKGKSTPNSELAETLGVDHVLQGSVSKAGDQVRITAQLIDARTDSRLWEENYERSLADIFDIQNEIAAQVVDKLKITLLDEPPSTKKTDPEAYTLYLQAIYLANQFTAESLARAAELYNGALAIDPAYAAGWSGLGWVYANQASSGHRPAKEALELAREATWTALAIDPGNARAYANVGWISMEYDNDLTMAAHHYGRALTLDPNDVGILNGAAVLTEILGRTDEAVRLYEYSVARDPVDANRHSNLAVAYLSANRPDDCITSIRTTMALSPGRIGVHYLLGSALLLKGDAAGALEAFEKELDDEYRVKGRALALYDLRRSRDHEAALEELRATWGDQWPSEVAQVYAWTGNADAAFDWLDKAVALKETGLMEQALSPFYKNVHDDPRWQSFLESRGHSPKQLARIRFDVDLPD